MRVFAAVLLALAGACGQVPEAPPDAGTVDAGCADLPRPRDYPDCPTDGCSVQNPVGPQCQAACMYHGCVRCTARGWQQEAWDCPVPLDAGM